MNPVRFAVVDIEPGGGDGAVAQGRDQRRIVDDAAARGIDQDRVGVHRRQPLAIDEAVRLRRGRAVNRDDIDCRQQAVHAGVVLGPRRVLVRQRIAIVIMNLHLEAARARRDHLPDTPHAENAETLAGDLPSNHERRAPVLPRLAAHQAFAFAGAARGAEHQQHGDFGGRIGQHVRSIGDDDAPALRRLQIDMIDAHRVIGDRPDTRGQALDGLGGKLFRVAGQDRVGPGGQLQQFVGAIEPVVGVQQRRERLGQPGFHRIGELAGDQYNRFIAHDDFPHSMMIRRRRCGASRESRV